MSDFATNNYGKTLSDGGKADGEGRSRIFTEASAFVQLLDKPGRVKILDTLIRRPGSRLTAEQIAKQGDVSESTFSRNKDFLLELGIIESSEEDGKTRYRINRDNDVVELLVEFHTELLNHTDEILEKAEESRVETAEVALELFRETQGQQKEDVGSAKDVSRKLTGGING